MKQVLVFCFAFLTVVAPRSVWAQATVNESLETAFIYVDAAKGSDTNPGTHAEPFKTISAATLIAQTNNFRGIGSKIMINPGIYRETITMMGSGRYTALPITFQANGSGVIVSGAVRYRNWQTYSRNAQIFTSPWNNNWGLCDPLGSGPLVADIVRRREMIFVGGVHLTQVLKAGQMREGTFFVDESDNRAYIWPAAGTDIDKADVEVATLPELLHLVGVSNVVVRGLTFQYASSCRDNTAAYVAGGGKNLLLDNDKFVWNNAVGLHVFTPVGNFTVQNSEASHNGQSGMMSVMTKNVLWKSVTTSFNNWRGAQGSYYNWNSGGIHFFNDHNHTVNGLVTAYNQTHGVHWDTDNANMTVTNLTSVQNSGMGVSIEKSEGPFAISDSHVCGNNLGVKLSYLYQGGLVLRNSEHVTLTNSVLYNNSISQIAVVGQKGGIEVNNWETGQHYNLKTQSFTHNGNTLVAVGPQFTVADSYLGGDDWSVFRNTLNSNKNTFWNSSSNTVFEIPMSTTHPLTGWRSETSQDGLSTWTKPASPGAGCNVPADEDYWLLADDASKTVAQDGTAMFSLSIIPFGGFSGTAALHYDGIKEVPGLTSKMTTKSVPLAGTSITGASELHINADPSTAPGTYPITVYATISGVTRTVTAFLVVPVTSIRLSTLSLDFGAQKLRTASPVQSFTVSNFGKTTLSLSGISFQGVKDFSQTNNCGGVLSGGETCTVKVTFSPNNTGARNATLIIADGDAAGPQLVTLTGTGK